MKTIRRHNCPAKVAGTVPLNCWRTLPHDEPFVAPEDEALIRSYNANKHPDDERHIHVELLPEPYLGNPDAPVVLLNLNPGFNCRDYQAHRRNRKFAEAVRANLLHERCDFPFYLLNPKFQDSPGCGWWTKRLRPLIEDCGQQRVAQRLFCVEYFPYHTRRFHHGRLAVPSQQYGFALVRRAIRRGALIIQMRSEKRWLGAIPELRAYPHRTLLKNCQSPYLSPGNCAVYNQLVDAINDDGRNCASARRC